MGSCFFFAGLVFTVVSASHLQYLQIQPSFLSISHIPSSTSVSLCTVTVTKFVPYSAYSFYPSLHSQTMGSHIVGIELRALSTDGHPSDSQTPRTPASDDNSSSIPTTVPPLHQAPTAPCSPPAPLSPSDRWVSLRYSFPIFRY